MTDWRVVALQTTGDGSVPADTSLGAARAIVALVVVFVLLAGFLWLLRRGTFSVGGRGGRQVMAVESALSLGERRSLVIVNVEGKRLLLGVAPSQVSLVTELAQSPPPFDSALASAMGSPQRGDHP